MPFGLTNVPAVFQAIINDVLKDMLNQTVFVYLYDILVFSPNPHSHVQSLIEVLLRLLEHKFFVKAEKWEFHRPSVSFLGYIISMGRLQRESAGNVGLTPLSQKKRFLGFANFCRKFIMNFSAVAAPLHVPCKVTLQQMQSSNAWNRVSLQFLSSLSQTAHASDTEIREVLSQHSDKDNKIHPFEPERRIRSC